MGLEPRLSRNSQVHSKNENRLQPKNDLDLLPIGSIVHPYMEFTMPHVLTYPDTLYHPNAPPDLSDPATQRKLSGTALRTFFRIATAWKIKDAEAKALLGGISNGQFYRLKQEAKQRSPDRLFSADMLTRISLLIGIYKALHILHSDELADRFMTLPNTNLLFQGQRPIDVAGKGGIPALFTIRRLLDARRGFLA